MVGLFMFVSVSQLDVLRALVCFHRKWLLFNVALESSKTLLSLKSSWQADVRALGGGERCLFLGKSVIAISTSL